MILTPWYFSGAKLRTRASIPIPDDRLSFLQLLNRANYLYITQTNLWSRSCLVLDVPRIVSTVTHVCPPWPYDEQLWPCGPFSWPCEQSMWIHRDLNHELCVSYCPSIYSYPPNLKVLSSCVCYRRIYIISRDVMSMLMHGNGMMAEWSSSIPLWRVICTKIGERKNGKHIYKESENFK